MQQDIDHIVRQCKKGKRTYQAALYSLFADKLYNAALRYGLDETTIQDHVHDAFVKIFTNISTYKGQGYQIYKWMLRILINEILQQKRKDKKMVFVDTYENRETEDGVELVMARLSSEEIRALIDKMSYADQVILNLSVVDGMNHKEITEILGISVQNSRTRLSRAKSSLRRLILTQYKTNHESV